MEVKESIGRGTSVNLELLHIIEISQKHSKTVFEKQISGFNGPFPEDYWEYKVEYLDTNKDSILEIVLTKDNKQSIYQYNESGVYSEIKN